MDYDRIYHQLIASARNTLPYGKTELHHIIPRSMGGTDHYDNLVRLTVRQHYIAHLLLSRLYPNQIFSVEAILLRVRTLKFKRYVRRAITYRRAFLYRERNHNL